MALWREAAGRSPYKDGLRIGYDRRPMGFPGGSAWSMARDIAEGFAAVTERSFRSLTRADLEQLAFELERYMRDLRGDQPSLDDIPAIQQRNRRIQRLNTATVVMRSYRMKNKI
jgi:hypothetical protein